jgi:hypothetical protein
MLQSALLFFPEASVITTNVVYVTIGDSHIVVAKIIEVMIPKTILGFMLDVCRNCDL